MAAQPLSNEPAQPGERDVTANDLHRWLRSDDHLSSVTRRLRRYALSWRRRLTARRSWPRAAARAVRIATRPGTGDHALDGALGLLVERRRSCRLRRRASSALPRTVSMMPGHLVDAASPSRCAAPAPASSGRRCAARAPALQIARARRARSRCRRSRRASRPTSARGRRSTTTSLVLIDFAARERMRDDHRGLDGRDARPARCSRCASRAGRQFERGVETAGCARRSATCATRGSPLRVRLDLDARAASRSKLSVRSLAAPSAIAVPTSACAMRVLDVLRRNRAACARHHRLR